MEDEVTMVKRHFVQGERHIESQMAIIDRLRIAGVDTAQAENQLALFEEVQASHREHLSRLKHGRTFGTGQARHR